MLSVSQVVQCKEHIPDNGINIWKKGFVSLQVIATPANVTGGISLDN